MPNTNMPAPDADADLLVACTRALLDGTEPPVTVDWVALEAALQSLEPLYPTIEEAMGGLRSRSWKRDA